MSRVTVITGEERRRRWSVEDQHRILAAAFAPGAVVAHVARQLDVATSLIYKWRQQALAEQKVVGFVPATLLDPPQPLPPSPPASSPQASSPRSPPAAIIIELTNGMRVSIDATAPIALVNATLKLLR